MLNFIYFLVKDKLYLLQIFRMVFIFFIILKNSLQLQNQIGCVKPSF